MSYTLNNMLSIYITRCSIYMFSFHANNLTLNLPEIKWGIHTTWFQPQYPTNIYLTIFHLYKPHNILCIYTSQFPIYIYLTITIYIYLTISYLYTSQFPIYIYLTISYLIIYYKLYIFCDLFSCFLNSVKHWYGILWGVYKLEIVRYI